LWNELPPETAWYEIELKEAELGRIRVFPRAQWRKIAHADFSLTRIVKCIQKRPDILDERFLAKLETIRVRMLKGETVPGSVILIGVSENGPLTVLDGNHRLVAAMMASPGAVGGLRFFCGLSPRMTECCWYNTSVTTLFHYGRNLIRHIIRRPKAELARILHSEG
jgi:hypothetical protein